ncbi:hypothetical protein OSB04_016471 [Centaurea solstitialis]|uniref:Uncharacterized protein n=1 Tax=Centaurea solstitialis TaxID=347529 RepID=A0AA38WL39_9ASTR|nr:hypothetical protein OSB04_016471 [Centaurea solstitialis]
MFYGEMSSETELRTGASNGVSSQSAETRAVRDSEADQQVTIGSSTYRVSERDYLQGVRGDHSVVQSRSRANGGRMCTLAKAREHVLLGGSSYLAYVVDSRAETRRRR